MLRRQAMAAACVAKAPLHHKAESYQSSGQPGRLTTRRLHDGSVA